MHEAKKRILVVDDYPHIRTIIETFIRDLGYDCAIASTGREALEAVKQGKYDLVLLDIRLADMSGYEVAKRMTQDAELTIVGMSADFSKEDREKAAASGMRELIYKEDLVSDLKRLIELPACREKYAFSSPVSLKK